MSTNEQPLMSSRNNGNNHVVRSPLLSNYLHLYLGCEVLIQKDAATFPGETGTLEMVEQGTNTIGVIVGDFKDYADYRSDLITLILRPLSSMSNEEFNEFKIFADNDFFKMVRIEDVRIGEVNIAHQFKATHYLLSKHFDLFGLIDSGFAIEAVSKR